MEYKNLFLEHSKDELRSLYEQYIEWCNTAIIPNNELGKLRDEYCEMIGSNALLMMEIDLLRVIAKCWYDN